ncbi:MAG: GNAT family N-acetyltransferase [Candidatus Limnocylindrales bacterium]
MEATTAALAFRRPVEADHRRLVAVVDDWWGGRQLAHLLPRLWLQFFTGTSWIAETPEGALAGFLVGFVSPDDPTVGYVHMVATSPNHRKRGLGRDLYEHFCDDVAARGVREVRAITWAGNPASIGFHTSIGFRVDDGPGTQRLDGTTAYPDYEGDGRDMVVFRKRLEG